MTLLVECCEHPVLHHQAVFEKYREKRFKEASTIVQDALDAGFTLPHHAEPLRSGRATSVLQDEIADHLAQNGLLVSTEG